MTYLFTYGSLMRGRSNHYLFLYEPTAQFIGRAKAEGYGLYRVSSAFPGAIKEENESIRGEVYKISRDFLVTTIDTLEANGILYSREKTKVRLLDTNEEIEAWIYVWLGEICPATKVFPEHQPWGEVPCQRKRDIFLNDEPYFSGIINSRNIK